jgi:hypothetical protein
MTPRGASVARRTCVHPDALGPTAALQLRETTAPNRPGGRPPNPVISHLFGAIERQAPSGSARQRRLEQ